MLKYAETLPQSGGEPSLKVVGRLFRDRSLIRLVLHGVLVLGVSAVGFLVISLLVLGSGMNRDMRTFTEWFAGQACERIAHSPDADEEIARFPAAVAVMAEKERLANVSHELRTPLARVRVVLETAKEDPSRAASL